VVQLLTDGREEKPMDWEKVRNHVQAQIGYWRAVGKLEWAEALEQWLANAE
jgi:hypothetical protein